MLVIFHLAAVVIVVAVFKLPIFNSHPSLRLTAVGVFPLQVIFPCFALYFQETKDEINSKCKFEKDERKFAVIKFVWAFRSVREEKDAN